MGIGVANSVETHDAPNRTLLRPRLDSNLTFGQVHDEAITTTQPGQTS